MYRKDNQKLLTNAYSRIKMFAALSFYRCCGALGPALSSSHSFEEKLVEVRGDMDLAGLLEAWNFVQINYRLDQNREPEELS